MRRSLVGPNQSLSYCFLKVATHPLKPQFGRTGAQARI